MKKIESIKKEMKELEDKATTYNAKKSESNRYRFLKTCYEYMIDPNFTTEFAVKESHRVEVLIKNKEAKNSFNQYGSDTNKKCYMELMKEIRKQKNYLKALRFIVIK